MKDFLFTLLAWLFTLPLIVGAIAFAAYNASSVPVVLNPFRESFTLPLYVPVLAAIGIGFVFGALMTWAAMGGLRHERSILKKTIKNLEQQKSQNLNTPLTMITHTPKDIR